MSKLALMKAVRRDPRFRGSLPGSLRGDPGFLDILRKIGGAGKKLLERVGAIPFGIPSGGVPGAPVQVPGGVARASAMPAVIPRVGAIAGRFPRVAAAAAAAGIGGFALEQLAELLGVRGGAGFIGPRLPGELGRRRRMNVLNPRALRRSMRRVQGFAKFAKKTISFTKAVRMRRPRRGHGHAIVSK